MQETHLAVTVLTHTAGPLCTVSHGNRSASTGYWSPLSDVNPSAFNLPLAHNHWALHVSQINPTVSVGHCARTLATGSPGLQVTGPLVQ